MKSHEQKFTEAIQALTYRLGTWGVVEPETKAREFILELTHHGWRGAFAELDRPLSTRPGDSSSGANAARVAAGYAARAVAGSERGVA